MREVADVRSETGSFWLTSKGRQGEVVFECAGPIYYRKRASSCKQAQSCILHQSLGGVCGDLGKLRFLLRREMYFHALQGKR